jgi:DNA processing protein
MMVLDTKSAAILAATELLPAGWRDLSEILESEGDDWLIRPAEGISAAREDALLAWLRQNMDYARVEHWSKKLDQLTHEMPGVRMLDVTDAEYPRNLAACWDRPPFIFVDGSLTQGDSTAIAIVGSRDASSEALQAAWDAGAKAARNGFTVVSGLARGVDTAAHEGALEAQGRTLAVLGCGIDMDPGVRAGGLSDDIRSHGALISQFRPGSPASRSTFPMRNAVISGLSTVSLLIDASERSGTRSEADHALRQGRRVLLWAPLMGNLSWATAYACQPGVEFVQSLNDVMSSVREAATNS